MHARTHAGTHTHAHTHVYTHTHTPFNAATVVIYNVVFILANAFFTFVDVTGYPSFMLQYKIQEDKNVPVRQTDKQSLCMYIHIRVCKNKKHYVGRGVFSGCE